MGSLFTALFNSASATQVFTRALNVIGNNIANVNTPGYAKQDQSLEAAPFEPASGLSGGVLAGPLISARSEYLEQAVRSQTELLGTAEQKATDLGQVEPLFDLTSAAGIAGSLNKFFDSFSQLSVNPNDVVSRQAVINQAGQLVQSIHTSASGINQVLTSISSQTSAVVEQINQIAAQIAAINLRFLSDTAASQDAGLNAQIHAALENLAEFTNFTVLRSEQGAYNVYIGGQEPLVIGANQYKISADSSSPQSAIFDSQNNDVTPQISRGRLGALLTGRNTTLPAYLDDLNTLAQSLADTVNTQLFQGLDQNGNTPAVNLFSYSQASDAATSLAVTGITPDQIAAAAAGAPGGNGNAVALAQLGSVPVIQGLTFTKFYGSLGSRVGNDVAAAQQDQTQAQDQLTQAQTQRASQSSVSLNEEATKLLQFQQSYQAAAKMVSVLQSLTQVVIDMLR